MRQILAAAALLLAGTPAYAQFCGPMANVFETLRTRFAEKPVWRGVIGPSAIGILMQSDNGTWTFLYTTPEGIACVLTTGKDGTPMEAGKRV